MVNTKHDGEKIDADIMPLVEVLNEIDTIDTYSSCEGHDGDRVFSKKPYVAFWVFRSRTDDADFIFPYTSLQQLSTLAWIVSHTFEDGFCQILDWDHRNKEPVGRIYLGGEDPLVSHDEVPELWTPVGFMLTVRDKSYIPILVQTIKDNWSLIQK